MAFSSLLKIVVLALFVGTVLSEDQVTSTRTYTDENGVTWTEETVDEGTQYETIDDEWTEGEPTDGEWITTSSGSPGSDGTPGTSGSDGTPGSTGTPGSDGTPGTPGSDGTPGTPGTPGSDTTPGTSGSGGTPGSPGSPGTSHPGARKTSPSDGSPGSPGKPAKSPTFAYLGPPYPVDNDVNDDNSNVDGENMLFNGGDVDEDGKFVKFNNIKPNSRIKVIFEGEPGACANN